MTATGSSAIAFHDMQPELGDFKRDVLDGLRKMRKAIPPKYFYDAAGSCLFDRICGLEEYYPTRTELAILRAHCGDIAALAGREAVLIEFGSGSGQKVPILLDAFEAPSAYLPIDICKEHLLASSTRLARDYPDLDVIAICADYTGLDALPQYGGGRRIIFFPGSTIGNYTPMQAIRILKLAARLLGPDGALLIGVDLKKDPAILHAAYNDAAGVTAAFNLNLLRRINAELDADFRLDAFRHHAFYNAARGRIEMHLLSLETQSVRVDGARFTFSAGESIHTENSCKYEIEEFRNMARIAGFQPRAVWTDDARLFSIHYLHVAP